MVGHGNRIIVRFSVVARPLQQAERRGVATHRHNSPDDLRTYKYRSSFFSFFPFFPLDRENFGYSSMDHKEAREPVGRTKMQYHPVMTAPVF